MPESTSLQLQKDGVLALPDSLRKKHNLQEGDDLHVIDLGAGAFVVTPTEPRIPELSDALEQIRKDEGVSTEDLMEGLREERRRGSVGSFGLE